jgi:hypothetical protein
MGLSAAGAAFSAARAQLHRLFVGQGRGEAPPALSAPQSIARQQLTPRLKPLGSPGRLVEGSMPCHASIGVAPCRWRCGLTSLYQVGPAKSLRALTGPSEARSAGIAALEFPAAGRPTQRSARQPESSAGPMRRFAHTVPLRRTPKKPPSRPWRPVPRLRAAATQLALTTWFLAIPLIGQAKNCMSSLELKRQLGVSYPTA